MLCENLVSMSPVLCEKSEFMKNGFHPLEFDQIQACNFNNDTSLVGRLCEILSPIGRAVYENSWFVEMDFVTRNSAELRFKFSTEISRHQSYDCVKI